MFTPIVCGKCTRGNYQPTRPGLCACDQCGHEISQEDFVLDPEEQLVCHDGIMQTHVRESDEALYQVQPTRGVHGPYVRATLHRALRRQDVFTGTDQVNAANRLKFEPNLPDRGPWMLSLPELRTLAVALRWRRESGHVADPRHEAIAQIIVRAYEEAAAAQEE